LHAECSSLTLLKIHSLPASTFPFPGMGRFLESAQLRYVSTWDRADDLRKKSLVNRAPDRVNRVSPWLACPVSCSIVSAGKTYMPWSSCALPRDLDSRVPSMHQGFFAERAVENSPSPAFQAMCSFELHAVVRRCPPLISTNSRSQDDICLSPVWHVVRWCPGLAPASAFSLPRCC